jgi:hypothetical protein
MSAFDDAMGRWAEARPAGLRAGAAILVALLGCGTALAAGQLDGGYGVGGYFLDPASGDPGAGGVSEYTDVAITSNGELRAVGIAPEDACRVTAVNSAGQKIVGWGGDAAAGFTCEAQFLRPAVALQADGQVIVASAGDWRVLELRRWSADGVPDASFGTGGVAAVELPLVLWGEPKLQVSPDGSIVVALAGREGAGCPGHFCDDELFRLAMVRLSPQGALTAARSDVPLPYTDPEPTLVGVAARPDGGVTTVVAGSTSCDPGAPCYFDPDSITLLHLATDGAVTSRVARWRSVYGVATIELDGDFVYVAKYDDDQGGTFLHRFDLAGNREGEPIRLASIDGSVSALGIGPSGEVYAGESRYDTLPGGVALVRSLVRACRQDGQQDAAFPAVGLDYGAWLAPRELRVAPAGRLTIAAMGPGRLAAVRLLLGAGDHPGRVGIVPRATSMDTGALVGQGNGETTTINQRDTTLEFAVDRTGGSEGAVGAAYRIDGNAAASGAFEGASGRLEWGAGELASKSISLTLKAGAPVGEGARVELRLSDPAGGATIGTASHVVHVLPPSPGHLQFWGVNADVTTFREGQSATVSVARRDGGNGSVSVRLRRVYVTALGQAANPDDFSGPGEVVLSWADGETGAKVYSFDIRFDGNEEPREYFRLELVDATGGATIRQSATIDAAIDNVGGDSGGGTPPPASSGPGGGGGAFGLIAPLALLLLSLAGGTARLRRPLIRRSGG